MGPAAAHGNDAASEADSRVKDPVCGMSVDPHTAKHRGEHAGRTYYFCSAGCRSKFLAEPERYLSPAEAKAEPVKPGAIYTCPMHPRSAKSDPARAPSAAWRWSRWTSRPSRDRTSS